MSRPRSSPGSFPVPAAASGLLLALFVLLPLVARSAAAQDDRPVELPAELRIEAGPVANTGSSPEVVLSFVAHWPGADSLRLSFETVELSGDIEAGTASLLRLTSLFDGAQQVLDAVGVRHWSQGSAYFNGDSVLVDVLAQPGTGPNHVVLAEVAVGLPPLVPKSICFSVDDRLPSNDPRVARLMPVVCTAWMIDDCARCFLSAGHCVGSINSVQFNVPNSTAGGSLQHPPPAHQYPVDPASIQSNGGQGTGNDWAYFGTFPNSGTGLSAFQGQGSSFELVLPPASTAGQTIRITGHGSDSSPPSWNHVQQTHTGPFTSKSGTTLRYQVDTTGGNSGSPVIHENTGQAIGIHTHGGCNSSGGSNVGTSSQNAGLTAALAAPAGICSSSCGWEALGGGLTGSFGVPVFTANGAPQAGSMVNLRCQVVAQFSTAVLVVGYSALNAPLKGGVMVPSVDVVVPGLGTGFGFVDIDFPWPAATPPGTQNWWQLWVQDPVGPQGWSASTVLKSISS